MTEDMDAFYVNLSHGLSKYYVKFEAPTYMEVQAYCDKYLADIYSAIYTDAYFYEIVRPRNPHGTRIVNRSEPIVLSTGWEEAL